MARGACKVVSINGPLTVTFVAASGATPTVYTDEACTSSTALPATIADGANATFYFASPGSYTLSVKTASGVQIAGDLNTTRVVTVSAGNLGVYRYDARLVAKDFSGDSGRHSPTTDLAPTLSAVAALPDAAGALTNDGAGVLSWAAAGGPVRTLLKPLHATYGDDFTAASLNAKWTRAGGASSGDETYQVDSDAAAPTWLRWHRSVAGAYLYQAAPAGDFSLIMRYTLQTGGSMMAGPLIVDATGTGVGATFYTSPIAPIVATISGMAYGGAFQNGIPDGPTASPSHSGVSTWLRLRKSGTNFYVAGSFDGEKWGLESPALSSSFTVARIGFGHWSNDSEMSLDVDAFNVV